MKKYFLIIISIAFIFSSCKTELEKLRVSNDPERMYQAANQFYEEGNYTNAQILYELIIPFYRGKEEAEDIYYKFAKTHYELNEYILASHYFNNFAKSFYSSPHKTECEFLSAYSKYKLSPSHKLDQSFSGEAIDALQEFINNNPENEKVAECNELIDEIRSKLELKAFDQGKLYYDLKRYISCINSFENMLKDFPDTERAEEVRYLVLKSNYNWAMNSVYEKKEERFLDTVEKFKIFEKKYPTSSYTREAKDILKNTKDELKILENVRSKNAGTEY